MKNTNYFQHDHNSRGDEKILKMRLIHGWNGFGLYWAIVEKLYESTDGSLENNAKLIAYDLQSEEKIIKSIIEDYGLFELNGSSFSHKRVHEHNSFRKHQAESGRKGGLRSVISKPQGSLEQTSSHKGKERKGKERKERKVKKEKRGAFTPPTLEEVTKYCKERNSLVDPNNFFNKNTSIGWCDKHKRKYTDWKAVIRTWEKYEQGRQNDTNESRYREYTG